MEKIYSQKYSNLILRDRYLLVIDNKNNRRICNINKGEILLAKKKIDMSFFDNKRINSFWNVDSKPYEEISNKEFFDENLLTEEEEEILEKEAKNNKEIYSVGSQKLTHEEIMKMKNDGLKGDELIKIIMDSNESMQKRTIFSQEKMLKKKKLVHLHKIWIVPTDIFNIIETFFLEDERRINFMRMDTFSTMLAYSKFFNDANTLIYEDIDNLLTSIYCSRSSVNSNIVSLFQGKLIHKNLPIFNLRRKQKNTVTYLDIEYFTNCESLFHNMLAKRYVFSFENLVICIRNMQDILMITIKLWDYLRHSGCLVVYSREIEYLVALEKLIFDNKYAIDVRIHETYLREYQVLSQRTHPMMNNKGFSGYVLSAIKVNNK